MKPVICVGFSLGILTKIIFLGTEGSNETVC